MQILDIMQIMHIFFIISTQAHQYLYRISEFQWHCLDRLA